MLEGINLYENKLIFRIPEEFEVVDDAGRFFVSTKPDYAFVDKQTNALVLVLKTEYKIAGVSIADMKS